MGVLSHYQAVVWETGDDTVTRNAGWGAGGVSRLALDLAYETRAYMNEGGKVLSAGKKATQQFSGAVVGTQLYDPQGSSLPCTDPAVSYRCLALRGSDDGVTTYCSTGTARTSSRRARARTPTAACTRRMA
jgi:hypothetical protein